MNNVNNKQVALRVIARHLEIFADAKELLARVTGQDIEEAYVDLREESGRPAPLFSNRARVHRAHLSDDRSDKVYAEIKKILEQA